ncbi:MAG TPA: TolC family protein [Thiobacillaceae bacterium]|nr:TolC family protein [Thiobacillaceae bacterium]
MKHRWPSLLLAGGLLAVAHAWGADAPLTLEEALARAEQPHPELMAAQARQDLADAELALAESANDLRITLEAILRSGHNPLLDKYATDHVARLNARKTLWDGGRQTADADAGRLEREARALQLLDTRAQRRLTLMNRFFDVLLTDQRYAAETEFMAVAYVNWDNTRDRHQLGQASTPELAELEARYQEWRLRRNDSERKARERRALLAAAMNQPGQLPAELAEPSLGGSERPLPEFERLHGAMLDGNPRLLAQRQLLAASRQRLNAVRANDRPSLEAEAEAAAYSRDASTRDDLRAGLNMIWPLYQGRRTDARLAREMANFHLLQAQHDALQLELRQALYETWQEIQYLREVERPAATINSTYRDWALERARAEYELELRTNLGTSMAETQAAKARRKGVEYRLALAWERLNALLGGPVEAIRTEEKKS